MWRNRIFVIALGVSTLLHLSMVTLFSIVVIFPREDIDYYQFDIVSMTAERPPDTVRSDLLRIRPSAESLGGAATDFGKVDEADGWGAVPQIELPTLEFAALKRLRLREKATEIGERYERLFQSPAQDPWARFGTEMRQFGEALTQLAPSWLSAKEDEQPKRRPVARHAAGFEFYIDWVSEPKDRQAIIAPPINALWDVDSETLDLPRTILFKVDPDGKVVEVLTPPGDEDINTEIGKVLRNYRFDPLPEGKTDRQQGFFVITAAQEEP